MTPARPRRWRPLLLVAALLASLAANAVLFRQSVGQYADTQRVRLSPIGDPFPAGGLGGVVYVGDSRVAGWQPLPTPAARNRGVGGETTAQLLLRLDRDVLAERPRVAVVQVGINDLKAVGVLPDRRDALAADCSRNIAATCERLRAAGVRVVLLTVWPAGSPGVTRRAVWSDATHELRAAVNRDLARLARDGVTVVDCDDLLAAAGRIRAEYAADHLHLSPAGYAAVAGRVGDAVRAATKD